MSEKRHYRVEGMTCAACAVTIQKTLGKLPQVANAEVSYAGKSAILELSDDDGDDASVTAAVEGIGYKLVAESLDPTERDEAAQKRLKRLRSKTLISAFLSLPVFVLGMWFMHPAWSPWVQLVFALPVMVFAGSEFFVRAAKLLRHGHTNMDTLVSLGTGTAFLFSFLVTLFPEMGKQNLWGHVVYFESAVVVITLVLLGRYLEERASHRTSEAVRHLVHLQPDQAIKLTDQGDQTIHVADVRPGDSLRIRPGDRIPVDGEVLSGFSSVDEAMLTGESLPVAKASGAQLFAGTLNQDGVLVMRADRTGFATRLSRIVRLVREAQASRAPIQQLVDRISSVFVPVVMAVAAISAAVWWLWGPSPHGTNALVVAVTVLVVACPCALGLATPTAIMVGIGRGAAEGILIRDAHSLQLARQTTDLLLDKTGTLTQGKPKVHRTFLAEGFPDLLPQLLAAEGQSTHPLAGALVDWVTQQGIQPAEAPVSVLNLPGKGLMARFGDSPLRVGSLAWAAERKVELSPKAQTWIDESQKEGEGIVAVTVQDRLAGLFSVKDPLRAGVRELLEGFSRKGIQVWMVTGDAQAPAEAAGRAAGIDRVRFGLTPEGKLALVRELQAQGRKVALVGDGINDAPALAAADLGIAIGTGSDAALESAGVVLTDGSLERLAGIFSLSHATMATLRRNLFWAFIYNLVMIPLAAGALYPLTAWVLDPMWAGAAMAASSVSVVGSSLLLLRWKAPKAG